MTLISMPVTIELDEMEAATARVGETVQWPPIDKPLGIHSLYDADEYSWLLHQADLLRADRLKDLDRSSLIEFLSDIAQTHKDRFESAVRVLLHHLLKVRLQPEKLTRGWVLTIVKQQLQAEKMIENNPGMKPLLPKLYGDAYTDAVRLAAAETGIAKDEFPVQNPWTMGEALAFVPPKPRSRVSRIRKKEPDAR